MKWQHSDHHRRSLRLRAYDYSAAAAYFLTLCAHDQECLFGEVADGELSLNRFGSIASEEWRRSAEVRSEISLDAFVVMPNHLHGILFVDPIVIVGAHGRAPLPSRATAPSRLTRPKRSLGSFVAGFKSIVTRRINEVRGTPGKAVWQRNYFEHIIRNQRSLDAIREYISSNPNNWGKDRENPAYRETNAVSGEDSKGLPWI
ncbi:MAG: transposase [Thermodesulfobacteriota bacterium]